MSNLIFKILNKMYKKLIKYFLPERTCIMDKLTKKMLSLTVNICLSFGLLPFATRGVYTLKNPGNINHRNSNYYFKNTCQYFKKIKMSTLCSFNTFTIENAQYQRRFTMEF